MKLIIQRVSQGSVFVEQKCVGEIGTGFVILLGVEQGDTEREAELLASKTSGLRIFSDSSGKMNLSLSDVHGEVLVISNFTLCGDCSHGRRPYFGAAAAPDKANVIYEYFCDCLLKNGTERVEKGIFGADMKLELINDGPVTIILDSKELCKK